MLPPTTLRCEYKTNPLGIDVARPRLSWRLAAAEERDLIQSAYQIQVAATVEALAAGQNLLWDSGKVESEASLHQVYAGPALTSGQQCAWRVRAWGGAGQPSPWSEPATWEMGLLTASDWTAAWIQPDLAEDTTTSQPCPMLHTTFDLRGEIRSARLYITALGLYAAELNGQRVSEDLLTPGWSAYDHRLQYQTYDVTALLQAGPNALGVTLGDGWYRGYMGFGGERNGYGDKLALLVELHVVYANGDRQTIASSPDWKAATGPILASDIYNGETYDARLEKPGWNSPGYDDSSWAGVTVVDHDKTKLVAPAGPPIRKIEEIRPLEIIHTPAGETVFDLGQNMVGWLRLNVDGPAGATIILRHAEVLDQDGNFYTENLRAAQQMIHYTLKGDGPEVYEPHFTFQGFRYVAVDGFPGQPTLDNLTGVVVHSATPPTGHFECDKPLLNQLQHNIVWGQKGNFVDVPTDCPQRDERLGWTGDAQVFIRTAAFNMDVASFFTKWLRDLAADQREDGNVPFVIPDILGRKRGGGAGSSAWGDAATICPWTIYLCYGDRRLLETQYPSMVGWVEYIRRQAGDGYLWRSGFHFGDWLAIQAPDALMPAPVTEKELIASAFFAYSTSLVLAAARVLSKDDDVQTYSELLEKIKAAFQAEFVTPNGRLTSNTQTAYVLALSFDLLPEAQRPAAARRLAADVRRQGNHLSTGFVGASYLCPVLSRFGYHDLAYALLNQEDYPSWLYPVKLGATTIWERWDGIKPDGAFQDAGMNSFNHYAYGAIGQWLYQVVAGIEVDPEQPGYKHLLIRPQPGGGLTEVRASLESLYGPIESAWRLTEDGLHLAVTVPPNTRATVRLPAATTETVVESGGPLAEAAGVHQVTQDGETVVVAVGSGQYQFAYPSAKMAALRHAGSGLGLGSSVRQLLDHAGAKAILTEYLPDLVNSPMLGRAMDRPLVQVAAFSGAPETVLEQVAAELAKL